MPRFRGKTLEVEGGWQWEMLISLLGEPDGHHFICNTIFKTKDEAIINMKKYIQEIIEYLSKEAPELNINATTFIDMKTDTTRHWDKSDEH